MWMCPICRKTNTETAVCCRRGFDQTADCEIHPTMSFDIKDKITKTQKRKDWMDSQRGIMLLCPECGNAEFVFLLDSQSCECAHCGKRIEMGTKPAFFRKQQANGQTTISAGYSSTVCLLQDGTIVTAGFPAIMQCNVNTWKNIVAVASGRDGVVGLRENGTVVATGENKYGECYVGGWTGIKAISAGERYTAALREDGTVVAAGYLSFDRWVVDKWEDIIAISAGSYHLLGLRRDGKVMHSRLGGPIKNWQDIIAVAAGDYHTIGLRKNGTVVAIGGNNYKQCNVSLW